MLKRPIEEAAREAGAEAVAVGLYDYEGGTSWDLHGDRPFHAASTMKAAVLVGLADAIERGRFAWEDRLHVRNRFFSAADGRPFRVDPRNDANEEVQAQVGRTMPLRTLAEHMIRTSSNLATNLLLDLVGVGAVRETLTRHGVEGVEVVRGVDDERAFDAGLSNTATANGLVRLFRLVEDGDLKAETREAIRDVLLGQAFRSGIPAGLPAKARKEARFAHKTGEISTVQHDAGLVYLPDRAPYALAILTEWDADQTDGRRDLVAEISELVYHHLTDA